MKELDLTIQGVQHLHQKTRDRKVAGLSKKNTPPTSLLPLYKDSIDHYGYRIHEGTGEGERGEDRGLMALSPCPPKTGR